MPAPWTRRAPSALLTPGILIAALAGGCGGDDPAQRPDPDGAVMADASALDVGVTDSGVTDSGVTDAGEAPTADAAVEEMGHLSQANLTRMIAYLADDERGGRDEGSPGGLAARAFIIEELQRCGVEPFGVEPEGEAPFAQPIVGGDGVNIIGKIQGRDPERADRAVLVSAHYDHIQCEGICNGADDNAAGVAILIATACELASDPPDRSVIVAAWDAEEPPTFLAPEMGSRFYAEHPIHPLAQTDVMIALDLVGGDLWPAYPFQVVLGVETSPQVADAVSAAEVPEGLIVHPAGLHLVEETPLGHQPWSDYDAFRDAGLPVLFFSNGQTKHYHQPSDELATLNLPKIALEARFLLNVLRNLGGATRDPNPTVVNGAVYREDAVAMQALLEAALAEGGLVDHHGLSARSRDRLTSDLAAVQALVAAEGEPDAAGVSALRAAAQRIMCLAGPLYPEAVCASF